MRVGIVSNSIYFIPLAYTLAKQNINLSIFLSPSADALANQQANAFVKEHHIATRVERNNDDLYKWLLNGNFNVCFVIGYAKLIKLNRLSPNKTLLYNIHYGLLPAYKGPSPIFWQLKTGQKNIGLTIHTITEKMDEGPIVWIKDIPNLSHYNYQVVNQIFSQLCVEGVFYILGLVLHNMPVPVIKPNAEDGVYCARPVLKDVLINWAKMGATEICNLINACNPWNKGALSIFKGQEIKLMDAIVFDSDTVFRQGVAPGSIVQDEGCLHVYCVDGLVLNINMLYFNECFLPAYHCKTWGLQQGENFS